VEAICGVGIDAQHGTGWVLADGRLGRESP
jgi:hypothetical protein